MEIRSDSNVSNCPVPRCQFLYTRNTDDPVEIERRLGNAKGEIEQVSLYKYAVVNDKLETAYAQVAAIVAAEKQRTTRYFPVVE